MGCLRVRVGKGQKDRVAILSVTLEEALNKQLENQRRGEGAESPLDGMAVRRGLSPPIDSGRYFVSSRKRSPTSFMVYCRAS